MENQMSELNQIKMKILREYIINALKTIGKVIDIYDGD